MRIGVFCSGGDAPGMNACVRAVVRSALSAGHEVVGIHRGYQGILDEDFFHNVDRRPIMTARSVSDIGRLGGTILQSSRCERFRTEEGRQAAAEVLRRQQIDALVPIGGDGTLRGAMALAEVWDGKIIACPGTIDNDLKGTDFTIGFFTAVQTAVEAVDKIRDTADSHDRMFLIEVMGRHSGFIAVYTALASGAELACIPETGTNAEQMVADLHAMVERGKRSVMMIVAEGDELGGAEAIDAELRTAGNPFSTRRVILGHLQRGGCPDPLDRLNASQMGDLAVQAILQGETEKLAGIVNGEDHLMPFAEAVDGHKPIPQRLLDLLATISH